MVQSKQTVMNTLFIFGGAIDQLEKSNHSKLMEFFRLEKEIETMYDKMSYKQLFHSFHFAVLNTRAKSLLEQLNII